MIVIFATLLFFGERQGSTALYPPTPGKGVIIYIADHGVHAGLILPMAVIRAQAPLPKNIATMLAYTPDANWIEVGWGDKAFYETGSWSAIDISMMAKAAFIPTPTVVHVVGFRGTPSLVFSNSSLTQLSISQAGLRKILGELDGTLNFKAPFLPAQGLYGDSRFFPAHGNYHMFNICNHRVAQWLASAGVPVNISLATWPRLLRADLEARAGGIACSRDAGICSSL